MQFPESWLAEWVDLPEEPGALAHMLTMAGLEVESVATVAPFFDRVVVARILDAQRHPDADRLRVCTVDVGQGTPLQIVCGAPNARAGLMTACARVGAQLPAIEIRQAKVRGVESFGMLCSARELGIPGDSEGIMELAPDAPVGMNVREHLRLDERIFELKITPNRADCLSIHGIAREIGALTGQRPRMPEIPAVAPACETRRPVRVEAHAACGRYLGRVLHGVDATRPTPVWMAERLGRAGVRPISALVDVTNYVLLELGQPMHAFDHDKLQGTIQVRMARAGETLDLLNGQVAELAPDMLVIADDVGPQALAGIMGGMASAVSSETHAVFLEAAWFAPQAIAGRGRKLAIGSDASHRFERGVDFAATRIAMERATRLILDICGGEAGPIDEVIGELPKRHPIRLRPPRAGQVLGFALDDARISSMFAALGLAHSRDGADFVVTPPSFRFDLAIEVDLIEELARLTGYDRIPARVPRVDMRMRDVPESRRDPDSLRALLRAREFQEVVSYSFVDAQRERAFSVAEPVALLNPIAAHLGVMRTSLMGSLLDVLRYNLGHRAERVRVFELGRVFLRKELNGGDSALPIDQPRRMAALAWGPALAAQWGVVERSVDFHDLKSDLEAILAPAIPVLVADTHPALHPGQSARVFLGERDIGWIGVLHPALTQDFGLDAAPVLFELDLEALLERTPPAYRPVSRQPRIRRDLALLVSTEVRAGDLLVALAGAAPTVVSDIILFDQYRGKGIDSDKKSLAFRVTMQDTSKTLTDSEADAVMRQLLTLAEQHFGAVLRA